MTKKPQDRKPKKAKTPPTVTAPPVVEVGGVAYTINTEALDDFELMDDLRTLDAGRLESALVMPRVLKSFLGDQYEAALNTLRSPETGRVSIEAGAKFIAELLKGISPN